MRTSLRRAGLVAAAIAAFVTIDGAVLLTAVVPTAFVESASAEPATDANAPKQVALSQPQIDDVIATQKDVRAIEGADPQDKPDPAVDAKLGAAVKAHGFSNLAQFNDVSFSIGLVMAGLDPDSKEFVGTDAVTRKQIKEIQADSSMPPKEKKEALAELNEALQQGPTDTPMPGNIAIVKSNFDKLAAAMQQAN